MQFINKKDPKDMELDELIKMVSECEDNKKAIDKAIKDKDNDSNVDLDLSWDSITSNTEKLHIDNVGDALVESLRKLGRVDIDYISSISDLSKLECVNRLKGAIFQDPRKSLGKPYVGYVTRSEYLSGNLLTKLHTAEFYNNKYHGMFEDNIKALKSILPEGISANNIYFSLSSPWIPENIIRDFISWFYNVPAYYQSQILDNVKHNKLTGKWDITTSRSVFKYGNKDIKYGTSRISAIKIIERILNVKDMSIFDYFEEDGKKKSILNKPETLLALERAKLIEAEFKRYVDLYQNIKDEIVETYNERYGYVVSRNYDGSFLNFPNLNPSIHLFDYQKNAVSRIIFNRNTLLAHNVGTGKTFVMIAAGEELLRMNLSKKNLYVVPNSIINQWEGIYKNLYPSRKLLVLNPKDFNPANYNDTLKEIRDCIEKVVIIPYSSFDRIPLSIQSRLGMRRKQLSEADRILSDPSQATSDLVSLANKIEKEIYKLEEELENANANQIYFEDLGFTRLFVDEAHNYKNVPITTSLARIKGINPTGSSKCVHMMDIVTHINATPDGGVIMATGTPITNSITDAYTFQKYLQNGELRLQDLHTFDEWVSMFAENSEELEIDVDTSNYRVTTRFSKFHNLPELTQILANVADFYYNTKQEDLPNFNGYTDVVIPKSKDLKEYLYNLSNRVEAIRAGVVKRKVDNMLKVTTDGRKAALDLRLIDYNLYDEGELSKAYICAKEVYKIYKNTEKAKATQLIFCDTSVPKDGFNLYDELYLNLVRMGVDMKDIVYIHDATTDSKRDKLFRSFNNGDIRIIIGSTFKLGTGVNVQERLVAIHHLDVPWRPADMVQREGRIIRQGNTNDEIFIYRYIKEGSFDAYSWQLLETKQNFINELLSNSLSERTKEDIQDTVLNYGEVKALAIGNPLMKKHVDLKNRISKLKMLDKRESERITTLKGELLEIPSKISTLNQEIFNLKADSKLYQDKKLEYSKEEKADIRNKIYYGLMDNLNKETETLITNYQGFSVIAPEDLYMDNLCVKLKGVGNYYLKLGNTEAGILIRIDNLLESFDNKIIAKNDEIKRLKAREESINLEVSNIKYHYEELELLNNELKIIEKELGL